MRDAVDFDVIRGYESQQFDFQPVLQAQSQATQSAFDTEVITACVNAEMNPGAGSFCSVTVVGHSDRNDSPGLTPEQRRENERQNSELRAEAAVSFIFDQIFARIQAAGGTPPVDQASAQNVTLFSVAAGAANLIVPTPATEDDRKQNRRVQFLVTTFTP
jgi:hypothetical protein